jgi:hypothetical protein
MTRLFSLLFILVSTMAAQSPVKADSLRLTNELESAILSGDWTKAAELSRALKTAAEDARNRSMASAGREQADSILAWLPADTETLLVAQQPFQIAIHDQTETASAIEMAQGFVVGLLEGGKGKVVQRSG